MGKYVTVFNRLPFFLLPPLGICLALIFLEILLRLSGWGLHTLQTLPIESYQLSTNPVLAYEFRPNYLPSSRPFDSGHQGFVINSAGFRDIERNFAKAPGTYRIAVLGDSTTAGNGIPELSNVFTERLEHIFKIAGSKLEVFNMGVGGYHTLQEAETLRTKGILYNPDLILVIFCVNDFDIRSDGGAYQRLLAVNNSLSKPPGQMFLQYLVKNFELASLIYYRSQFFFDSSEDFYRNYNSNILKSKNSVEAGLTLLAKIQKDSNIPVIFFILPAFFEAFDKYSLGHISQKAIHIAQRYPEITTIDLINDFQEISNNAQIFSLDGLHMNKYGHQVMADILAKKLEAIKSK